MCIELLDTCTSTDRKSQAELRGQIDQLSDGMSILPLIFESANPPYKVIFSLI